MDISEAARRMVLIFENEKLLPWDFKNKVVMLVEEFNG